MTIWLSARLSVAHGKALWHHHCESRPLDSACWRKDAATSSITSLQSVGDELQLHFARLDLGEIEQVVDQREQVLRPALDGAQLLLLVGVERPGSFISSVPVKNVELAKRCGEDRAPRELSHELAHALTPSSASPGRADEAPGPLNADQEKQLRTVQSGAKHLLALINDLLDLAKIESGKVS